MADTKSPTHPDRVPILTLDTFTPWRVDIDGAAYNMIRRDRMAELDLQLFDIRRERCMQLFEALEMHKLTPEGAAELRSVLDQLTREVLDAPDEVHQRLSTMQRFEILSTFWVPPRPAPAPRGTTNEATPDQQTGGTSSPASSDSMAPPIPPVG